MKRIYKAALLFTLLGNVALAQTESSFFVPTTYRGAFEPAPAAMWTDSWANWDPQNTVYPSPTVTITSNITTNTTWTSGNVYLLQGQIYVKTGATLTIQPGTIIMGDKAVAGSGLFITKGSKINAQGTASQPIVFTSNQAPGSRALGDWGGLILLGKGSLNLAGGIANIEGIAPSSDTEFGGGTSPDDDDNSGVLSYVRIEFPGYVYAPNKEINGLTLGAVGRNTKIDHVQVSFCNDDAFEWFGGSVNCRYLVSYRNLDDDFDTDNGWSGHVQFALSVRDPSIADAPAVSTSEGFESDNDATGSTATPKTKGKFANLTLIGPYRGVTGSGVASGYRRGARLRRNTELKIYNSIFMDHIRGIHIDAALAEANATAGLLQFRNNLMAGNSPGFVTEVNTGSTFGIDAWFVASGNDSLLSTTGILTTPYNYTSPDYRPATGSPALTNFDFSHSTLTGDVLIAPTVTSTINYCVGASSTALTATKSNALNTLNWYTVPTGGTASTVAPTPSTLSAGTFVYYVSQMNADGYEGPRATITVNVNALPTSPVITPSGSTSFCTGGSVDLTSSYSSGNVWSTTATSNSITVNSSGTYTVTHTDVNGCSSTSLPITVSVSSAPVPTISLSGSTTICAGETITLTASTSDSYSWSPGGETTQSITVSAAGTYNVTTTNADACDGVGTSANTTITVSPVPTAAGSVASISGAVVTFANTSSGATSYNWDFGDASNSSATAPVHAYAANGNYTVTLVASNGICTDTTIINVSITVGVEELELISSIKMFPNPVNNFATLEISVLEGTEANINLFDVSGKLISTPFNGYLTSGLNTVNVNAANLDNGIYFAVLNIGKTNRTIKMIVSK